MDFWGKNNNTTQPGATTPPVDKPTSTQPPASAQSPAPAQTPAASIGEPKKDEAVKTDGQTKNQWDLPKSDFSPTGLPDTSSDDNSDFSYAKKESIDDDITVDNSVKPASDSSPLDSLPIPTTTPGEKVSEDSGSLTKPQPVEPSKTAYFEEKSPSASSLDDLESKIKSQKDELQGKIDKLSGILEKIEKLRAEEKDVISQASAIIE